VSIAKLDCFYASARISASYRIRVSLFVYIQRARMQQRLERI